MTRHTNIREVVGIFENYEAMGQTIDELERAGIGRHLISVLGSEKAMKERFGTDALDVNVLEDNPESPRSPFFKQEELSIAQGALISCGIIGGVGIAILAFGAAVPGILLTGVLAGGAGGGAIGAAFAKMLEDKYSSFFQKQIDNGGVLLWVNCQDEATEEKTLQIMKHSNAHDVHIHEFPMSGSHRPSDMRAHG
ncbi:MAG: hypothetical protein AB7L92_04595 [Alphaproteobacteria bacterium]